MARSSDSVFFISLLRDKSFQAREIRRVIMLSLLYLLVTTAMVGLFYHQMLGKVLEGMSPLLFVSEDIALANEALPAMSEVLRNWMLVMLGVNVVITTAVAIFITRKLGQPILAIKRALREIGAGNLDVRLRSSDKTEFGEIASELTKAMQTVRLKIVEAKESVADIPTLHKSPAHSDINHAEIDTALSSCRSALDFFQVEYKEELKLADDDDQDNDKQRHVA